MKQKRKVKNLLLKGDRARVAFFTILLLILSVILCIGAVSLMTSSALAEDTDDGILSYTGLDLNKEVLYEMRFFDKSNPNVIVSDIFIEDKNLYFSSGSVIVNPLASDEMDIDRSVNEVGTGIYGHILGGRNSKLYSKNVTIIAGSGNILTGGNDNATILGGVGNRFEGRSLGIPMVSIGGRDNKVGEDHNGIALIGGQDNKVGNNVSNTFIIGGENNVVETGVTNAIIGGKNVKVISGNVFVYSNSDGEFKLSSGNVFVLNLSGGVGINSDGAGKGLSIENAVSIGDIDISDPLYSCDDDKLGVIGSYSGCVIGCTKVSKSEGGKWEILNGGDRCSEIFLSNSGVLVYGTGDNIMQVNSYNAQCTVGVNTGHAHLCPNYLSVSRDVIYETSLVDSDGFCPIDRENQCVFQCDEGYHLTGENQSKKCYMDCELPWNPEEKIKHGITVTGYNTGNVSCSNDDYIFPIHTAIENRGFPGQSYSRVKIGGVGVWKASNGVSPETCENYTHKRILICNDGVLELMDSSGKPIPDTSGAAQNYKFETCNLYNYSCDTGVYILTSGSIISDKDDKPKLGDNARIVSDRGILTGERALYKICYEYNAVPANPTVNGEKCNVNGYKYQFIDCLSGYDLQDGLCKERCTLKNRSGGGFKSYVNGEPATGYQSSSATCTGTCVATGIICNDGKWRYANDSGSIVSGYQYNDCMLNSYKCEGYTIYQTGYNEWSGTSIYESCDPHFASGQFLCVKQSTKYKLVGCKSGHHVEDSLIGCNRPNRKYVSCPDKPLNSHWNWTDGRINDYGTWEDVFGTINLNDFISGYRGGYYVILWTGEWSKARGGRWDTVKYPNNACDWTCDSGYHEWNGRCELNVQSLRCGSAPLHSTWARGTYTGTWNFDSKSWSEKPDNTCVTGNSQIECSFTCNYEDGYVCNSAGTGCRAIENGECHSAMYKCKNGRPTKTGYTETQFTRYCEGLDSTVFCSSKCNKPSVIKNGECMPVDCYHCAKSGFPYCFPLDFNDVSCSELTYIEN